MNKELVLVILIVVAILVSTRFIALQPETLDQKKAVSFVLQDISASLLPESVTLQTNDNTTYKSSDGHLLEVELLNTTKTDGSWRIFAKISMNPHSACPNVTIRDYAVQPSLTYKTPEQITHGCIPSEAKLIFPEEAIIASNKAPELGVFKNQYCSTLLCEATGDARAYATFYSGANETWLVKWTAQGQNLNVVINAINGSILNVSKS